MKKYYTILLGKDIWEGGEDDMNTNEIWATHGMVWTSMKKATACMKNAQRYDIETDKNKFSIKQLYF